MKRILVIAAALVAAPLTAQSEGESEASDSAQTAARVTQAIREGADLKLVEGLFGLSTPEYDELARLKGCQDAPSAASNDKSILTNWTCDAQSGAPGMTRTTQMIFDDGVLVGFAVNPSLSEFAPADGANPASSASDKRDLAERLAAMVAAREADRVGDLVPVNAYQTARLGYFGGGKFRVSKAHNGMVPVRFKAMGGQELESYVHFDVAGHPIGLTFAPTACANCKEWARSESQRKIDDRRKRDRRFLNSESNARNTQRATDSQINRAIRYSCPDCP